MPSGRDNFRDRYEAEPDSVSRARGDVASFAVAVGANATKVTDIRLAVSEAVTNAVLHGYRGAPGDVHVAAEVVGEALWVEVCDTGYGIQTPRASPPARPGLGLGLGLIAQIVDELSVTPLVPGGTRLRMRFDLVAAGEPSSAARQPVAA